MATRSGNTPEETSRQLDKASCAALDGSGRPLRNTLKPIARVARKSGNQVPGFRRLEGNALKRARERPAPHNIYRGAPTAMQACRAVRAQSVDRPVNRN